MITKFYAWIQGILSSSLAKGSAIAVPAMGLFYMIYQHFSSPRISKYPKISLEFSMIILVCLISSQYLKNANVTFLKGIAAIILLSITAYTCGFFYMLLINLRILSNNIVNFITIVAGGIFFGLICGSVLELVRRWLSN